MKILGLFGALLQTPAPEKKPVIFEEVFHATKNAHLLPRKLRAREEGNWELTIACCELPITLSNSWVVENADAIAATDASKICSHENLLPTGGVSCVRLTPRVDLHRKRRFELAF